MQLFDCKDCTITCWQNVGWKGNANHRDHISIYNKYVVMFDSIGTRHFEIGNSLFDRVSVFDRVPCGGRDVGESAPVMSDQNSECCAPLPPLPAWTTNLMVSFQSFLSILDYF